MSKTTRYREVRAHIQGLIEGETDEIAVLATVAAELYHAFEAFDWVGFYRVTVPGLLKVGPYQGGHGCLTIPFERGVCGRCARERATQLVPDVHALPYHIACASSTRSEIVVPLLDASGAVRAVLDVDSDQPAAFDTVDQEQLEALCREVAKIYG
jgi:L-methionine (R)-S-oxide reductase